jgi:hypothetical protein
MKIAMLLMREIDSAGARKQIMMEILFGIKDLRNARAHDRILMAQDCLSLIEFAQLFFHLASIPELVNSFKVYLDEAQML